MATDGSTVIAGYINQAYGTVPMEAAVDSDTKLTVSLPEEVPDISSFVLDLAEKFGATCDFAHGERGSTITVWHTHTAEPAEAPAASAGSIAYITGAVIFTCGVLGAWVHDAYV